MEGLADAYSKDPRSIDSHVETHKISGPVNTRSRPDTTHQFSSLFPVYSPCECGGPIYVNAFSVRHAFHVQNTVRK